MAREMKDSGIEWIGEIPQEWDLVKTKHCYSNQKVIVGENADEYERLALTLNGVIKRSKYDSTGLQPEVFTGYQILHKNELVFKLIDLENISTSRVGYSPYTGIVSPAYIVLHPDESKESRFGEYYFLSMWQREIFNHMGDDGVRSSLNAKDLMNTPYLNASSMEKERIVYYLDTQCAHIDSVIEKTRAAIEEYKRLKQSVITQAVTKGIRPNREMKDSGIEWIGEIPKEWNFIISRFLIDQIGDVDHYMPVSVDNGIPYVMTGNLKKFISEIDFEKCKKVSEADYNSLCGKIKHSVGDVIFARYATIGTVCYVDKDEKCVISYSCVTIKPNKKHLDGKFLFYYLQSSTFFEEVSQFINSNTQGNVGIEALYRIRIPKTSISEQSEIVSYLDEKTAAIDSLIQKKEQLITELEAYKKSLIYEYVTGKKEVPVHAH